VERTPLETCPACGLRDDKPKHHIYTPTAPEPFLSRHITCCAASGCDICGNQE